MRIIDRDITFYQGARDQHVSNLMRSELGLEPIHRQLVREAEQVIRALEAYRDVIDKYNTITLVCSETSEQS